MSVNRLIYLPLGGAGEIGMNCYVYGYGPKGRERLIVVDLGVTFADMDTTPGVDLIMPSVDWLAERADQIEAIFITHGHEDHIGAIGHLWPRLRAPVVARKFTGALSKLKMEDQGVDPNNVEIVEAMEWIEAGPFQVQYLPISHSIPESAALLIKTPAGTILHSGDFKLDAAPGVGEAWDPALYAEVGRAGVKYLMCDSTNIFSLHPGRSESTLAVPLRELLSNATGMVAATTFASNLSRVKTLAEAGRAAGRQICLMGRAMRKMVTVALETGVMDSFPPVISPEEAANLPRHQVLLLTTGTQGERRAASAQLSRGKYLGLSMKEGDTFLFSSRTIPGNERDVLRIMNAFSEMGVDVVDDAGGLYHVSGHANRPDLETLHNIVNPRCVIPMHGEHRHMREHMKLAQSHGRISEVVTNGMMMDLTGDRPVQIDQIETGRVYLDGSVLIGAMDGVVRNRIRMALNGHAIITLIMDEDDAPLGEPWAELMGLPEIGKGGRPLAEVIEEDLAAYLERAGSKILRDDEKLDDGVRRIVRQVAMEEIGKKPEVTIVVSRLA